MIVRVGTVTNIYPAEGKVRVLYEDRDETSVKLPLPAGEYKMPEVGAVVVTMHMQGQSGGFVLGEYWSEEKEPEETGEKLFRKQLGEDSYLRCVDKQLKIYSPELIFQSDAGTATMEQIMALFNRVTDLEDRVSSLGV